MRPLYHIKWTAVVSLPNFFDIFPSLQPSIPPRRREALHREQKNGQGMAFPCLFRFAVFAPSSCGHAGKRCWKSCLVASSLIPILDRICKGNKLLSISQSLSLSLPVLYCVDYGQRITKADLTTQSLLTCKSFLLRGKRFFLKPDLFS